MLKTPKMAGKKSKSSSYRELIRRGHSVTTIRFAMEQPFNTGGLGPNHTEFVLFLNNSMGQVDHVTKVSLSIR